MPPLTETPAAALATGLADAVMEKDVGGTRRMGAGPGANHTAGGQGALHCRVIEPLVQEVRYRHGHDVGQLAEDGAMAEQMATQAQYLAQVSWAPGVQGWRGEIEQRTHHLSQSSDGPVVLEEGPGVVSRELGHLGSRPVHVLPIEQGAPVGEGHEIGRVERVDLVAKASQAQLPDDGWSEQADYVGEDRDVISGPDLLGHRRTADPGS